MIKEKELKEYKPIIFEYKMLLERADNFKQIIVENEGIDKVVVTKAELTMFLNDKEEKLFIVNVVRLKGENDEVFSLLDYGGKTKNEGVADLLFEATLKDVRKDIIKKTEACEL